MFIAKPKASLKVHKSDRRQGIVGPLLFTPFTATAVPALGAATIWIYATYGNEIRHIYNSLFGEFAKC